MKFEKNPTQNQFNLEIAYDLVSTKIEVLNQVIESIREAFKQSGDYRTLVIDLEHCSMVDSQGLNYLISLHKLMKSNNASVSVKNAGKNVRRTFIFSRLDQYINIE